VRSYLLNSSLSLVDVSETVLQQSSSKCCGKNTLQLHFWELYFAVLHII